ncbi:hypothetical protein E2C01_002854 [Portunus trituberculatus]|uniref:Secreted protein n=1 Tax=Portunus trituberculatus TaxID=210409 RepID=A0A5B7CKK4_PORTR|nr:hypothetical protein [Portunus trituberculatus]
MQKNKEICFCLVFIPLASAFSPASFLPSIPILPSHPTDPHPRICLFPDWFALSLRASTSPISSLVPERVSAVLTCPQHLDLESDSLPLSRKLENRRSPYKRENLYPTSNGQKN